MSTIDEYQKAIKRDGGRPKTTQVQCSFRQPHNYSKAGELRRLEKERPDLHEQVLAGEKSTHAAMLEAGFLPHRVQMPVDDMYTLAAALRRHLDPAQRELLSKLLTEG